MRGPVPLERDAFGYWHLSALAMQGDWLMLGEPIAYRTPVYPWFLALVRPFAGIYSLWTISLIQAGMAVASMAIAARMATKITNLPLAAVFTLVLSLPAISALTFCSAILSETLFVFLLMLNLSAVLAYSERPSGGRAIWAGITFALTLLTRPVVLLLWIPHVVLVAISCLRRRRRARAANLRPAGGSRSVLHLLMAAAVVAIFCGPWLLRHERLFGEPFLTKFLGRSLWFVTFQDGSGAGLSLPETEAGEHLQRRLERVGAMDQWHSNWGVSNALVRSGLSDPDADRLMKQVAIDALKANPGPYFYKQFRRTVNFWRCAATDLPDQGSEAGPFYGQVRWQRTFPIVEWALEHRWSQSVRGNTLLMLVMIASLLVLLINPTSRPYGIWLSLLLGYFCVVTGALGIPDYRYRMVVEPVVAAVIGSALAVLLSRRRLQATLVAAK